MSILFASRRASPSAFRRIHDDRTPQVDAATSGGRADFLRLANDDFVPNTIIGPACSERPLRLGSRPAKQFSSGALVPGKKESARWGGSTSASYRRGGLGAAKAPPSATQY